jgi:hypothetical protein
MHRFMLGTVLQLYNFVMLYRFCDVQFCNVLFYYVPFSNILLCIILFCDVPFCNVLYVIYQYPYL